MTYAPTADTYIFSGAPDTAYDTAGLDVGKSYNKISCPHKSRILINFDVSSLPGETVSVATLNLYCYFDTASVTDTMYAYRCKRAWTEGGTWNKYGGTNSWQEAGGKGADDIAAGLGYATRASATTDTWATVTSGLAALVQDAIDNRSGILSLLIYAVGDGSPNENNKNTFRDSEYATAGLRPYLDVTLAGGARRRIMIC